MTFFSRLPMHMQISRSFSRAYMHNAAMQRLFSTETIQPAKEKKVSTGRKLIQVVKEHGTSAVIVYGALWLVPFAGVYSLGAIYPFPDPIIFAEQYLPTSWMDSFYNYFGKFVGLSPGQPLSDKAVRIIWALVAEDVTEVPRVLATVWLAPKLTRWRMKSSVPPSEPMK